MSGGTYGMIPANIVMTPGQSIRRRVDDDDNIDNGFESYSPPIGVSYSQSSPGRALNSVFVPSATKNAFVSYSVSIATSLSLTGGSAGNVFLEVSANGSTGWVELARLNNTQTGTLTIGLALSQTTAGCLSASVPASYSVRLRTANVTGTPTYTLLSLQETLI